MRTLHVVALVFATASTIAAPLSAQRFAVAGIGADSEVVAFLRDLQAAVRSSDSQAVARLVKYPLTVNDSAKHTVIKTEHEFMARYHQIVTVPVREAVLAQVPESLFANWRGIMIGRGQVWFGMNCLTTKPADCKRLGVEAINRQAPSVR
jgi:hypothetical protein